MRANRNSVRNIVLVVLLGFHAKNINSQVQCSSFQDCNYAGCAGQGNKNTFGCCAVGGGIHQQQYGGSIVYTTWNSCYGKAGQTCIYYYDYGSSWGANYCDAKPCDTACTNGKYIDTCYCTSCSAGSFCNGTKYACPTGTFSGTTGMSTCTECPAGSYSLTGQSICSTCDSGSYSNTSRQSSCHLCPVNTYLPSRGGTSVSDCLTCPPDTLGTTVGQSAIETCTPCAQSCLPGQYKDCFCRTCPTGTFSTSNNETSCKICQSGTFNSITGATSMTYCNLCTAGSYSSSGSSVCLSCSRGTYNSIIGNSACINCNSGTFSSLQSMSVCDNCNAGSFSMNGSSFCTTCTIGKFALNPGSSVCTNCIGGTYSSTISTIQCQNCSAGSYSTTGASSCTICPYNTYASKSGQKLCDPCPAEHYLKKRGGTSSSDCVYCPGGTCLIGCNNYQDCQYDGCVGGCLCVLNGYGDSTMSLGGMSCNVCTIGNTFNYCSKPCSEFCPPGQYLSNCFCSSCPAKYYCPGGTGATSIACASGTYTSQTGSTECTQCRPGTYSTGSGSSECFACTTGTYNTLWGSNSTSDCKTCAAGYTSNIASTTCSICPVGTMATPGSTCNPCLQGKYNPSPGASICNQCT